MIGEPPVFDGGVKLTWMPPCTCTALMPVGAPGGVASTSNGSLRPPVSASPLVRLALSSAPICAVLTVAPATVQVFVPAAIVHVVVPPSAPGPTRPSAIAVLALTGAGVSPTSRLSTTTLNAVPTATELPLLTLVMASRAAGPTTRTLDGERPRPHRAVAELAFIVLAPAHHADLGDHRAGVVLPAAIASDAACEAG